MKGQKWSQKAFKGEKMDFFAEFTKIKPQSRSQREQSSSDDTKAHSKEQKVVNKEDQFF